MRYCTIFALIALTLALATVRTEADESATVVCPVGASHAERLACKEIRRFVYLRTGKLPPIVEPIVQGPLANPAAGPLIVVGRKDRPELRAIPGNDAIQAQIASLPPEACLLEKIEQANRPVVLIAGGDDAGVLYGAYRFAERLGVRFYLHGDVVPDRQVALELPPLHETRKPLFDRRGILPFHDFPEGPDWWSRDGYKAILSQLPKLGMNFIGLHTYPEGGVGPEPLVWIGMPDEMASNGNVTASYPSRHFTSNSSPPAWAYLPCKTGDYVFGAAELFDRDDYGTDYMRDTWPWNQMSPERCDALFNRTGEFFGDVLSFAHRVGVKTCVGTETPLTIPTPVKQRLQAAGKNPSDPAVVQELYEGMFQRLARIGSLDYYWLWTSEEWTWSKVKQEQIDAVTADLNAATAAARKVNSPFTLATSGWVLGPPQSPELFDNLLPKDMPMSCISRMVGNTPVEPGFAKVAGRPKWAIPWLEDDPGMTIPQLWAGRMRRDAADALRYGCTGLMGLHWRTRILAPNVAALADAAWDQTGWKGDTADSLDGKYHFAPAADFYADWARSEFGPEAAESVAAIFLRLDGRLPRPADWVTGPGSIKPEDGPWEQVQKEYAFVDELAALRPQVNGAGNLERFDYWLNNFRYLRSIAQVRTVWTRFNKAMETAKSEKNPESQKRFARDVALPIRKELVAAFAELHRYLLATVTNPGEMGNVANWQQQTLPVVLGKPGQELAKLLGEELPADAVPSKQYVGEPRLFVPEVRSSLLTGESLNVTMIVLGGQPQDASFFWRPLGKGEYAKAPLVHAARGVYRVTLPADSIAGSDFEYYVQAAMGGQSLVFPATAPTINQTIVVAD